MSKCNDITVRGHKCRLPTHDNSVYCGLHTNQMGKCGQQLFSFVAHQPNCDPNPIVVSAKNAQEALTQLSDQIDATESEIDPLDLTQWDKDDTSYLYWYPNPQYWMELNSNGNLSKSSNYLVVSVDFNTCEAIVEIVTAKNHRDVLKHLIKTHPILVSTYRIPNNLNSWSFEENNYVFYSATNDYYISIQKIILDAKSKRFYHK